MRSTVAPAVAVAAIFMAACGGGGGGGSAPGNPAIAHYEVATVGLGTVGGITYSSGTQAISAQALVAVDPANPQRGAITIEPAGTAVVLGTFYGGTLSGGQLQAPRSRYTLYVKDGGFYRVDHDVPAGTAPAGKRVSSLATAAVCGNLGFPIADMQDDFAAAERTWVFVLVPGADGLCGNGDDALAAVRLDTAAGVAPRTLGGDVRVRAGLRDATGALTGFLSTSSAQAFQVDLNFNSTPLFPLIGTFFSQGVEFAPSLPGLWLRWQNNALHAVSLANPATTVPVVALAVTETVSQIVSDGTRVFVLVNDAATSRVLSFPASPLATATEIATFNRLTDAIALTPTRVLAASTAGVVAFPKAGGVQTAVITLAANETVALMVPFGETVYADVRTPAAAGADRARIDVAESDGSNLLTLADTRLVAGQFRGSVSLASGAQPAIAYVASPANAETMAGATLRSIDGATRTPLLTYGRLPAAPDGVMSPATATFYGDPVLMTYATTTSSDLFVVDSDAAGSLVRVTNLVAASAGSSAGVRAQSRPRASGGLPRRTLDSR